MCISLSQLVRNIGIAVFAGVAVFACLRRLNIMLVINMLVHVLVINMLVHVLVINMLVHVLVISMLVHVLY